MSIGKGRVTALVATVVAILALAVGGTAWANDGSGSGSGGGGCAGGQSSGHGTIITNSFDWTLCRHSANPNDVSGFFRAVGVGPTGAVVAPQGPVTCAAFQGDEVSFLYPLTTGSRPPLPSGATAILIYGKAGGPGVGKVGFTPPLPTASFGNKCDFTTPQAIATKASAQPVVTGAVTVTK